MKMFRVLLIVGIVSLNATAQKKLKKPGALIAKDSLVAVQSQQHGVVQAKVLKKAYNALKVPFEGTVLMKENFSSTNYGTIPFGWEDMYRRLPSRNWMVDSDRFLRPVLKKKEGLIAYQGALSQGSAKELGNVVIKAKFKKTEDDSVVFGIAGRIQDRENFYAVLMKADNMLTIVKVQGGKMLTLTDIILLKRYRYPSEWSLTASFTDDLVTGILHDAQGNVMARADARDGEYAKGSFGLYCTEFAGCKEIVCYKSDQNKVVATVKKPGSAKDPLYDGYALIPPVSADEKLNTKFNDLGSSYDIIVAGAGTGGWAAAVQAARMGNRVLLLEETDWIGGQMVAAAVTSMDESGPQVRERGIYREFHESMIMHYYNMDKSPFMSYYSKQSTQNQQQGGYAPKEVRDLLYGFIKDAKQKAGKGCLDLILRSQVRDVVMENKKVKGIKLAQWQEKGKELEKNIHCKILIDATEHGDVIPLTGAAYRVGNTKSEQLNLNGAVQDYTYTGVIREYPNGIPEHLKIKVPPPNYEQFAKAFRSKVLYGSWGLHRGQRMFRVEFAWRGMTDKNSPINGRMSGLRHTLAGLNGGNDYHVSVATIEVPEQRLETELGGINKTLSKIYYFQHELGIPWSFAEDQGYNTAYNRMMMEKRNVVKEMLPYAKYLPQMPYVRESRRVIGIKTLVADDLKRWEKASHFSTSIAMGDYFMDLHGTADAYERDLDTEDHTFGSGPFQVPFEAFIPKDVDGFLPAEKNFSQSRLVSGATRLQPITMLTGQAVGTIAALCVKQGRQPREINPLDVQFQLLDEGSTLIQRWYKDVSWGTELWKAVQMMSLYKLMDRPGDMLTDKTRDGMEFRGKYSWGVAETLTKKEAQEVLKKLIALRPKVKRQEAQLLKQAASGLSRGEFAVQCFKLCRE